ncbi:hypothetical protein BKA93DRAFT_752912 [Sparassis latifolia]
MARIDPCIKAIVDGLLPQCDVLLSSLITCSVQLEQHHLVVASYGVTNAENLGVLFEICRTTPTCGHHLKRLHAQMMWGNMAQCHEDIAALCLPPVLGGMDYLHSDEPQSKAMPPPTSPMIDTSLPPSSPLSSSPSTSPVFCRRSRPPLNSATVLVLVVCKGSDIPLIIPTWGIRCKDYLEFKFKQFFIETVLIDDSQGLSPYQQYCPHLKKFVDYPKHMDKQYLLPGDTPVYCEKGSTWNPSTAQIANIQVSATVRLPALMAAINTFAKNVLTTPSSSSSGSQSTLSMPSMSSSSWVCDAASSSSSSRRMAKHSLSPDVGMEGRKFRQMDKGKAHEVIECDIELTDDEVEAEIIPNDDVLDLDASAMLNPILHLKIFFLRDYARLNIQYRLAYASQEMDDKGENLKCISWHPVELAVLDEKHVKYLSHKLGSEERAAILKAEVAALQNVSPHFARAALPMAHEKVQVFFKNTHMRTSKGVRCEFHARGKNMFIMRKCSSGDSVLWAKDDEGHKIWEAVLMSQVAEGKVNESNRATVISSVKSKCFKALSDEEKHTWKEKAEELHKEQENLSIDDLIADNQEGLFVKVASALQGLIGSKGWQAGEDVGFHLCMVYKSVNIMPARETESFSTFEGGNEAEDACWERFIAQAFDKFLVNRDPPRARNDVGKPVLLQMKEDRTPMHVGKTLKEYMKELWLYTHTDVEDLPELSWDALGDIACKLVAADWRGSVGDLVKMKPMQVMALYLRMYDVQDTDGVDEMAIAPDGDAVIADGDAIAPDGDAIARDGDATDKEEEEEEEDDDDDVIAQTPSRKQVIVSTSHSAAETVVAHGEHTVNKGKGVATAGDAVSVEIRHEGDKVIAGCEDAVDKQHADGVHERDDESDADAEGEDNDEEDGRIIKEVVKVMRGTKWKQGPCASTSTLNTKAAGWAVNKKHQYVVFYHYFSFK